MKLLRIFIFGLIIIFISRFAYPLGVSIASVQLNPSFSSVFPGTQTSSTVTVNLNNGDGVFVLLVQQHYM